ncbi:MAG: nitroreductase family protein [Acidobacteria bacterium]|nr:nitroreductase family protein [Acidobacteriota bacterium]
MIFSEILKNRRSIRSFEDKAVPPEIINSIINDSILAPSAGNEQPWKFIIINNKDMINRIAAESKKNLLERIASNPNHSAKKYEKMLQNDSFDIYYNAPTVILILGDAGLKHTNVNCALAASYLMMSATSRGLGTCWVAFGTEIYDPQMIEELGIPENYKIIAPIAIGYPTKIPDIPHRNEPQIIKVIN